MVVVGVVMWAAEAAEIVVVAALQILAQPASLVNRDVV